MEIVSVKKVSKKLITQQIIKFVDIKIFQWLDNSLKHNYYVDLMTKKKVAKIM